MFNKLFLFAVLLLAVGIISSPCYATMWRYIVPDVRQLPPDQAEKKLTDKGYQVKTIEVPAENYSQVGKVMKQDPAPGEYILVWNDWIGPITLYIAKKGSFVPDILLKTEAEAINTIKNAGYVPKVEYYVNENQGIAGKVWTTGRSAVDGGDQPH